MKPMKHRLTTFSVLLTAAVVGAIYLARREPAGSEEDK